MDPASLSNLDPKLRETYERVMGATPQAGTASPPPTAADAAVPDSQTSVLSPTPTEAPLTAPENASASTPEGNTDSSLSASPVSADAAPATATVTVDEQPKNVTIPQTAPAEDQQPINQIAKPHGHSGLIKIFYMLGATVFFVIYIFFWVKIFNFQLPF